MLKRHFPAVFLLAFSSAFAGEADLWIESRGVDIPVTLTTPDTGPGDRVPLVVFLHGHGGSRHENGGFTELASMLAANGIASVRMDFPGCGESTEAFVDNNITNMLHDIESVTHFAANQPGIDGNRVGILGYSMGGRLAMLADLDKFSAMVLWAPVAENGPTAMFAFFGGKARYLESLRKAEVDGAVTFTTPWGQQQQLGQQWFADMSRTLPLEAIDGYNKPILVLHGTADKAVPVANASRVRDAAPDAIIDLIEGAGHGFGFFGGQRDARPYLLGRTVSFFETNLRGD